MKIGKYNEGLENGNQNGSGNQDILVGTLESNNNINTTKKTFICLLEPILGVTFCVNIAT